MTRIHRTGVATYVRNGFIAATILLAQQPSQADIVYLTARPEGNPSPAGVNFPLYIEPEGGGADTSAAGTATGSPSRSGCRFFSNTFSNRVDGSVGFRLSPTLGVPGGIYEIHHNFNSVVGGNVSSNISLTVTCSVGGTLSFWNSGTNFIGAAGNPANQWKFLGYLTNNVDSATPVIDFGYLGGIVNAGVNQRLLVDCFRFRLYEPCVDVPEVGVTGPLGATSTEVVVTGVSAAATNLSVYQNSGSGMVLIGTKTSGVTAGNNSVPVTGLVKGAIVGANQTINGQQGCVPTAGTIVGGGANPRLRVVLSVRESTNSGPVGVSGSTAGIGANIHFLGASFRTGSAPGDGPVVQPSPEWQTLTFDRGTIRIGNSANAAGALVNDFGYAPGDSVAVRVFAYRDVPENNNVRIFSPVAAQSAVITSNDSFAVNWTWNAVPNADGYRLLRNLNNDSYTNNSVDITGTSFLDQNNQWVAVAAVTPKLTHTNAAVKWNAAAGSSAVGTVNDLQGDWGTLDAIALAIDDLEDTGPFDLYIDNVKNGTTVFQTFENAPAKTTAFGFVAPGNSGTTSGNLLSAPNVAVVSNDAADTGTKSLRVRFQFLTPTASRWVRLTTSGAVGQNPQINLDEPTSLRILLLPVGSTPVAPPAPTLDINQFGANTVLTWTGSHRLQAATNVAGPYTTITGVTNAPYTNTLAIPERFFRLLD